MSLIGPYYWQQIYFTRIRMKVNFPRWKRAICALTLFLTINGAVLGNRGNVYPYSHPCTTDEWYYEDSSYVLKDLIAGKIDSLHIQFHNCA